MASLFASLTCPICAHPLIVSTIMSDGTFIHNQCALLHFSQTPNPKSLLTNEKLKSTTLIPNHVVNKLFLEHIESTTTYDEYFQNITLVEIEQTNLYDLILKTPKLRNLRCNNIELSYIKYTNTQITNQIFTLITDKQEGKIFKLINSSQFDITTFDFTTTNAQNKTLLNKACENNLTKFTLWLINTQKFNINHKSQMGDTPLLWAAYNNNPTICEALIKNKAEIHHLDRCNSSALLWACKNNMIEIALLILSISDFTTHQLHQITTYGNTVLTYACKNDMHTVTDYILTHFSKDNIQLNIPTRDGKTPLMIACENNNTTIVSQLLRHPLINVNYTPNLLKIAYYNENTQIIIFLLQHKNIQITDTKDIILILSRACNKSHNNIISHILSNIVINMEILEHKYTNKNDETILSYMEKHNLITII